MWTRAEHNHIRGLETQHIIISWHAWYDAAWAGRRSVPASAASAGTRFRCFHRGVHGSSMAPAASRARATACSPPVRPLIMCSSSARLLIILLIVLARPAQHHGLVRKPRQHGKLPPPPLLRGSLPGTGSLAKGMGRSTWYRAGAVFPCVTAVQAQGSGLRAWTRSAGDQQALPPAGRARGLAGAPALSPCPSVASVPLCPCLSVTLCVSLSLIPPA